MDAHRDGITDDDPSRAPDAINDALGTPAATDGGEQNSDMAPTDPPAERLVGSLLHGLQVLDMFDREHPTIGIGEMSRALKMHKSSASRLAATLAAAGYLEPADSPGRYRLGGRLLALGQLLTDDARVERVALPYLRALADATGETGHLARLDGADALTVAIASGWHTVRMHSWVGKRGPAHRTATGKTLLAGLTRAQLLVLYPDSGLPGGTLSAITGIAELAEHLAGVRARGYAVDREELEAGLTCVGAPIFDAVGAVVASLSVSGPVSRLRPEVLDAVAAHVRWAASQASTALGAPQSPADWTPRADAEPEPLDWVEAGRHHPAVAPSTRASITAASIG